MSLRGFMTTAIVVIIVIAIVWRVNALRSLVTGA